MVMVGTTNPLLKEFGIDYRLESCVKGIQRIEGWCDLSTLLKAGAHVTIIGVRGGGK